MGKKDGGDDLYIQRQNVPISKISDIMQIEIDSANKPDPEPAPTVVVEEEVIVEDVKGMKMIEMLTKAAS